MKYWWTFQVFVLDLFLWYPNAYRTVDYTLEYIGSFNIKRSDLTIV